MCASEPTMFSPGCNCEAHGGALPPAASLAVLRSMGPPACVHSNTDLDTVGHLVRRPARALAPHHPGVTLNSLARRSVLQFGMHVLLVDDNKAMRLMVRQTLLQTGMTNLQVEEAENGSDALAKLCESTP